MKKILLALVGVVLMASFAAASVSVGVDSVTGANALALRYDFTKEIFGKVGIGYSNITVGGGSVSTTAYGAQIGYLLPVKLGGAKPLVAVNYSNDGANPAGTVISLKLGAEIQVADGVMLSAGITPYASATNSGYDSAFGTGGGWMAFYAKIM
ncbi:MAG: hypothetical protein WC527_04135 [Candidatus Margulisiibacteriota bacterium]